jgi:hypothetical protein
MLFENAQVATIVSSQLFIDEIHSTTAGSVAVGATSSTASENSVEERRICAYSQADVLKAALRFQSISHA